MIPALGREKAAALHCELTEHTIRQTRQYGSADTEVCWTAGDESAMRVWLGADVRLRAQCGGDLGARMADAFRSSFGEGIERVVLIGCDCPDLGPDTMRAAFESLESADVVFGPATDGGYYLVGIRRSAPPAWTSLFDDIEWSTERVLAQSLAHSKRAGLSSRLLAPLDDVDRPDDLPVWAKHQTAEHPWLSVIIPTLNEEARLARTLAALRNAPEAEVLVVDGGSTDSTLEIAGRSGVRCFEARGGRAAQMNFGSAKAAGDVLLFLHADTIVPSSYAREIQECLDRPRAIAGAFDFATDFDSPAMRVVSSFARIRARRFKLPYGDQGLFLRKSDFRRAGGFALLPIMEDYEFVRRLRRYGRIEIARAAAVTSGDRWKTLGVWRTTLTNAAVVARYHLGASPDRLAKFYRSRTKKPPLA